MPNTIDNPEIHVLVGGTPCQDFSVAGLRLGLAGERSNIVNDYIGILRDKQPRWFVWENVPGVLSSGKDGDKKLPGLDFACLLSGFTGQRIAPQKFTISGIVRGATDTDYSIAWRVLDSRYFGVPQRRRRVFVIGYIGKDWRPPVAVLFERESLRRDFTPGSKKGKATTGDTKKSARGQNTRGRGGVDWPADTTSCPDTTFGDKMGLEDQHINGGSISVRADEPGGCWWDGGQLASAVTCSSSDQRMPDKGNFGAVIVKEEEMHCLNTNTNATGRNAANVCIPINTMTMQGRPSDSGRMGSGIGKDGDPSPTLTKSHTHGVCLTVDVCVPLNTAYGIQGCIVDRDAKNGGNGLGVKEEEAPTLTKNDRHATAYDTTQITSPVNGSNPRPGDPCHTLAKGAQSPLLVDGSVQTADTLTKCANQTTGFHGDVVVTGRTIVRRLTPTEFARLQGFPDDWAAIPGATDANQYEVFGNSMTTNAMHWLGARIDAVDKIIQKRKRHDAS